MARCDLKTQMFCGRHGRPIAAGLQYYRTQSKIIKCLAREMPDGSASQAGLRHSLSGRSADRAEVGDLETGGDQSPTGSIKRKDQTAFFYFLQQQSW